MITTEILIGLFSTIVVFLLGFLQWRSKLPVEEADTSEKIGSAYDKLVTTLNARVQMLETKVDHMEQTVDRLEEELRKWRNAYARALRYITENVKGVDIPDFLKDTGKNIKAAK